MLFHNIFCSVLQARIWVGNLFCLLLALCSNYVNSLSSLGIIRNFSYPVLPDLEVYWNVPTYKCKSHGFDFENMLKSFGIIDNNKDSFRGEKIIILYDPGMFPVLLKDHTTNKTTALNGGGPHNGSISLHLSEFTNVIEKVVPVDFSGLGIIDFETWRPNFRQNWNDQTVYKLMAIDAVQKKNVTQDKNKVLNEAKNLFETSARQFMERTLLEAKKLRPGGLWGYYGFPYCLNYGSDGNYECPQIVKHENDEIDWLFRNSDAFYPSLYSPENMTGDNYKNFIVGRLNEAWRVSHKVSPTKLIPTYCYMWYRCRDTSKTLTAERVYNTFIIVGAYKMGGIIIWGSSHDLSTKSDCESLYKYINKTLGPNLQEARRNLQKGILTLK